jgi:hypothetical protein
MSAKASRVEPDGIVLMTQANNRTALSNYEFHSHEFELRDGFCLFCSPHGNDKMICISQ